MKTIKENISQTDIDVIETFRIRYPGWTIIRYTDNSLEFKQPIREDLKKKKERVIWRI